MTYRHTRHVVALLYICAPMTSSTNSDTNLIVLLRELTEIHKRINSTTSTTQSTPLTAPTGRKKLDPTLLQTISSGRRTKEQRDAEEKKKQAEEAEKTRASVGKLKIPVILSSSTSESAPEPTPSTTPESTTSLPEAPPAPPLDIPAAPDAPPAPEAPETPAPSSHAGGRKKWGTVQVASPSADASTDESQKAQPKTKSREEEAAGNIAAALRQRQAAQTNTPPAVKKLVGDIMRISTANVAKTTKDQIELLQKDGAKALSTDGVTIPLTLKRLLLPPGNTNNSIYKALEAYTKELTKLSARIHELQEKQPAIDERDIETKGKVSRILKLWEDDQRNLKQSVDTYNSLVEQINSKFNLGQDESSFAIPTFETAEYSTLIS